LPLLTGNLTQLNQQPMIKIALHLLISLK
jgi:hypothetical protein